MTTIKEQCHEQEKNAPVFSGTFGISRRKKKKKK
jgi:hypothetical protein